MVIGWLNKGPFEKKVTYGGRIVTRAEDWKCLVLLQMDMVRMFYGCYVNVSLLCKSTVRM